MPLSPSLICPHGGGLAIAMAVSMKTCRINEAEPLAVPEACGYEENGKEQETNFGVKSFICKSLESPFT